MRGQEPNLVLTGFMGTGKSEVARRLAHRFDRKLLDMDREIERRQGCTISELFAERGEAYFRECEQELAQELSRPSSLVVATGGGVVLDSRNISLLQRGGIVVCLEASVSALLQRLAGDAYRPLLAGPDAESNLRRLLAERAPAYARIPHHVATDGLTVEQVADRVWTQYLRAIGTVERPPDRTGG